MRRCLSSCQFNIYHHTINTNMSISRLYIISIIMTIYTKICPLWWLSMFIISPEFHQNFTRCSPEFHQNIESERRYLCICIYCHEYTVLYKYILSLCYLYIILYILSLYYLYILCLYKSRYFARALSSPHAARDRLRQTQHNEIRATRFC